MEEEEEEKGEDGMLGHTESERRRGVGRGRTWLLGHSQKISGFRLGRERERGVEGFGSWQKREKGVRSTCMVRHSTPMCPKRNMPHRYQIVRR